MPAFLVLKREKRETGEHQESSRKQAETNKHKPIPDKSKIYIILIIDIYL